MKKLAFFACLVLATAALAGVNNRAYNLTLDGTNVVTQTMFVYGEIAAVQVTSDEEEAVFQLSVSGGGDTILNSEVEGSGTFHPVVPSCSHDGNAYTNSVQVQRPCIAGPLTCSASGSAFTSNLTVSVSVIYIQ